MISFPNAKINLGLNIIAKRSDGFHNLETCFYPIPWSDILEIIPSTKLQFTATGLTIPGDSDSNLCLKAYHLIKEKHDIPPVHVHLHKVIPMGAGLGGGSADGAFMLKMLNDKFELGLSLDNLESIASKLGSDCPFFIRNIPIFAEGTGTLFSEINLNLTGKHIALVHPHIHVSTQQAYAGVAPKPPKVSIREIVTKSTHTWKKELQNDFETSIFKNHPEIWELKEQFYTEGAIYAAMSGSGSCVFGIFDTEPTKYSNRFKI